MKMKLKPNFERKRADRPTKRLLRDRRFCIQIKNITFTEGDVTARRFHLFGTQYVASETRVRLYWQHRSSSHICPVLPYRRFTVVGGGVWQTIIGLIQNRLVWEGKRRRHCQCFQNKCLNADVNRKHWEMRSQESNEADQSAVTRRPINLSAFLSQISLKKRTIGDSNVQGSKQKWSLFNRNRKATILYHAKFSFTSIFSQ